MQVRVLVLVGVGRGTHQQERRKEGGGERQRDQEKKRRRRRRVRRRKAPWGWAEPRGSSLRRRQNSKWVFEEVEAETRLVSHGGEGESGRIVCVL